MHSVAYARTTLLVLIMPELIIGGQNHQVIMKIQIHKAFIFYNVRLYLTKNTLYIAIGATGMLITQLPASMIFSLSTLTMG